MGKRKKQNSSINMGPHSGTRFSEFDLAARRTTIPLHSFLRPDELSMYYVLDRLPVRSEVGLADNNIQHMLARIMGTSLERVRYTIDKMASLGIVVQPGTNTTYLESVIEFKIVYDLCVKLGSYPFGFGEFLRNITGNTNVDHITPKDYVTAYKNMNDWYDMEFSRYQEKKRKEAMKKNDDWRFRKDDDLEPEND